MRRNLSNDYVVGLVDGEGSFTAYVKNPALHNPLTRRVKVEPRFYIKLIEKDKHILYELKKYFGCGNVYFQKDTRINHQNCYRFEVTNREDLEKIIIPFFTQHKLQFNSKQKDFKLFCEIMKKIKMGEHLTDSGLLKIYNLKQKMH
ncbi:MAG: hypothetical protein A3D44_00790 [Candidatus Staskawiczbacteria bacterium RIFCSPHIGHO2_02_FULL_42_22]|uniref:Homing endonuclease LAGLIDADG domain-containing protein n=1 Tax=Candidatus Staskawiczbacteria bacterium RIFCSPHIGHO2_02_FULL_42_22 TaxID=1802207 RepID=A0A1G2I110_9BACT|nr:MAG: hypothetical protein A3D44_00790 [Candidatus Staskawiczbacteria bacterium RIFCSPHIGHO2_02_FULL_42_22]